MTYPPPAAANGDYSSHSSQNVTYLPPTAAGGAVPDPDAADEIQGGRRAGHAEHHGISSSATRPGPPQVSGRRSTPRRPSSRRSGVVVRDQDIDVHVIGRYGVPLRTVAAEVRRARSRSPAATPSM